MNAYVGIEGFLTKSGFILKELCIFYDGETFDQFIFKEPTWSWELPNRDLETIQYISSQLNGLHLYDGSIPYNEIYTILECIRGCKIYTFSSCENLKIILTRLKTFRILGLKCLSSFPIHIVSEHTMFSIKNNILYHPDIVTVQRLRLVK